jgi:glycogen operon protein
VDEDLLAFTCRLIALRKAHPVFRRRRWFQGRPIRGTPDIAWFRPDGVEMDDADWESGFARSVAVFLNGDAIPDRDDHGRTLHDDWFCVILNAHTAPIDWTLPSHGVSEWTVMLDTAGQLEDGVNPAGKSLEVAGRSCVVLRATHLGPPSAPSAGEETAAEAPDDDAGPQGQPGAGAPAQRRRGARSGQRRGAR